MPQNPFRISPLPGLTEEDAQRAVLSGNLPDTQPGMGESPVERPEEPPEIPGAKPGGGGGATGPISVPGVSPSAGGPRTFPRPDGSSMTINDPTVGYSDEPGGQPKDGFGNDAGQKNPSAGGTASGDSIYSRNYRDGSPIRGGRMDNDGLTEYSRFRQALGHTPSDDDIRQYIAAHPDEWEMKMDPKLGLVFRQKQGWLNDPANGDSKTGANSTWQTKDFVNAYDSDNEQQAEMPGGGSSAFGADGGFNPLATQSPYTNTPMMPTDSTFFTELMDKLRKQTGLDSQGQKPLDRESLISLLG